MTTLTAATSRRSLLFLAGAGFLMLIGIVFTAMAGNPIGFVLLIVGLPLGVAGVAWLGAAEAKRLGFMRRAGGLVMLLATVWPVAFCPLLLARR